VLRSTLLLAASFCLASTSIAATFNPPTSFASATPATISGTVTDPTGAIIPGAQVQLEDSKGKVIVTGQTDAIGAFRLQPSQPGDFTLVFTLNGFKTTTASVHIGSTTATPLQVTMPIAEVATEVTVNGSTNVDLTSPASNTDNTVMTAEDLKALPVFDNDYVTAMSAFLDPGAAGTAGSGLIVDGVESNRATVSPSAVQEVHINEDPYSARYYFPGRGQMEIITKASQDKYHGQFNFFFRDSALNAQNAFAPSKPFEQRRIYEGNLTGPIAKSKANSFLFSFNRAEEDLNAVVNATVVPTAQNPSGEFQANVAAPTRDTEFSIRGSHKFNDNHSAYLQYSYQDSNNQNQGVGNQTLQEAGINTEYREDDLIFHDDDAYSPSLLNQISFVVEKDSNRNTDAIEAPKVNVQGNFVGGSAQNDSLATEYNTRLNDIVSWTRGPHQIKFGVNVPHIGRRVFEDHSNERGTYTYSSLSNYRQGIPASFSLQTGQSRFLYHQQEVGAFVQDQIKLRSNFSITPGLRYDWQNLLGDNVLNFSPRLSFALVLDQASQTVVRGGGGIYYDRFGSSTLLDLARYRTARRLSLQADCPAGICPPPNSIGPALAELRPGARTPYQIHYGLSIERRVGERATATISFFANRGVSLFRSVDINAPTPQSGYTRRPNPAIGRLRQMQPAGTQVGNGVDISYRGRYNKYFTGFAHYTWSHYENNASGIAWFPQNQFEPNDEWSNADFDQRQRLGLYGVFNPESILTLSVGIFASTGKPWTIVTGDDDFGDNLFNARPEGVARNSETGPDYVDMDLRWGHDFHIHPDDADNSPTIGFSASAFNVLNHLNGSFVDTVEGSTDFAQVTSAQPPRRIQLGMRLNF
jgi:Carboxypeptidase regulatory-like domain/TonB dependent receptor